MSLQQLGGRKFLATLVTILCASVLAWFGKLDSTYSTLVAAILGGYFGSNVTQRVLTKADKVP